MDSHGYSDAPNRDRPNIPVVGLVGLIVVIIALVIAAAAVVVIGSQPATSPAPPFGPAGNGLVAYAADGDVFVRDMHGGPTNARRDR